MRFIFSTGSLYTYGVDRCFELAARSGFDGIEIMVDHRWDTRQPDHLQRLVDRYRLAVVAVHSPFTGQVPGWPNDEPDRIRESTKLAETLGATVVIHHLPPRAGWTWVKIGHSRFPVPLINQRLAAAYRHWLEQDYQAFQAGTSVKLCIENMPARYWLDTRWNVQKWNTPAQIARFPNLTLDTTHLGTWRLEPSEIYPQWGKQVGHVHLSNFNGREHRLPQDGHLHLDKFLAQLAASDYQGAVSLELHPDALEAGSSDARVVELLIQSLSQCRAWVAVK